MLATSCQLQACAASGKMGSDLSSNVISSSFIPTRKSLTLILIITLHSQSNRHNKGLQCRSQGLSL